MHLSSKTEPEAPSGNSADRSWSSLVERVRTGEPAGMEELYGLFDKGLRYFLCRQTGFQDLEDRVHDIFLAVAQSIQRGDLRDPERLMGYIRTVLRRQVATHIERQTLARRHCSTADCHIPLTDRSRNPERILIDRQNTQIALRMLNGITARDREVLVRFYLEEQNQAEICRDLELTNTQFRLIKSRAKARFGELGRRRLAQRRGFRNPAARE